MKVTRKLIEDRCERVGDCLIWQQAVSGQGAPIISLSQQRRAVSVRRLAWEMFNGKHLAKGQFVYALCGQKLCLSDACLRCGSKSDYMRNASRFGVFSTPEICAIRADARRKTAKLDWPAVAKIRADRQAGKLLREIGAEHGISMDVASKVARGLMWREQINGASVFGWRP
jgi:hypothetical protein